MADRTLDQLAAAGARAAARARRARALVDGARLPVLRCDRSGAQRVSRPLREARAQRAWLLPSQSEQPARSFRRGALCEGVQVYVPDRDRSELDHVEVVVAKRAPAIYERQLLDRSPRDHSLRASG